MKAQSFLESVPQDALTISEDRKKRKEEDNNPPEEVDVAYAPIAPPQLAAELDRGGVGESHREDRADRQRVCRFVMATGVCPKQNLVS